MTLNKLSSGNSLRIRTQRIAPSRPAMPLLKSVRKSCNLGRSIRALSVRADDGFDLNKALKSYKDISYKIPPVVSAATLPVVGISLLCKLIFGTGLPGTLLGGIEGVSYLVLLLGAGSLLPRLSSIVAGGDYTFDAMLEVLQKESDGMDGKDATSRFYNASVSSKSALNAQMEDLKKRKAEKAAETPEEKAAREAVNAKIAAIAIETATKNQEKYAEEFKAPKKTK
eukprot:CAMPEP_0196570256 /NCGR_PEP_ID=MMETSP1081-20130531/169_1 /TAXON_ID=36882 /ORGANISM="Pyramimonas amylifera, Strain CCMP720" /LENGTH=225 /DNA_ID=CAMNT_0041886569 /DNA_START=66 /DNA_END=743 /DNA_ORIENTATION=-